MSGPSNASFVFGSGFPSNIIGNNGDFYINTYNGKVYGPKANDIWPIIQERSAIDSFFEFIKDNPLLILLLVVIIIVLIIILSKEYV